MKFLMVLLQILFVFGVLLKELNADAELRLTPANGKISGPGIGRKDLNMFYYWDSTDVEIFWDIEFASTGNINVDFKMANRQSEAGAIMKIDLGNKNGNQTIQKETEFSGGITVPKVMRMGSMSVKTPGKLRLVVRAISKKDSYIGDLFEVILSGPGVANAKVVDIFPPNADSTHLWYSGGNDAMMFYNEIIINQSFPSSYFMAVGFDGGYFGIQENDFKGYKKALFSLWDTVSQERSADDDLAAVEKVGKGVTVKRFGGEGTGYQSFIAFPWKIGEKYQFLVTAKDETKYFVVTAYIYYPEEKQWKLMSSLKRVVSKKNLSGYYSFLEDWEGKWGYVMREASFNPWVRKANGEWFQPQSATFTRTGKNPYVNAWVQDKRFYMSTGGDGIATLKYGDNIYRTVSDELPESLKDIDNLIAEEKYLP